MSETFTIVGIGASAGGLDPMKNLFSAINPTDSAAFVVISHLPISHVTNLDAILKRHTSMPVHVLEGNTAARPGQVYVLPGYLRVKIVSDVLLVRNRDKSEVINSAIDEFFLSLAKDKKSKGIAVILSGLGSDGAQGARSVHDHGGVVIVQDPDTTEYESMPDAAIKADDPLVVGNPIEIAGKLNELLSGEPAKATKLPDFID